MRSLATCHGSSRGMAPAYHIGSWLSYNIVKAPNVGNTLVSFSQRVMRSTRPDIGLTMGYALNTTGHRD
jgi:hypothetical protein